eukprot:UN04182
MALSTNGISSEINYLETNLERLFQSYISSLVRSRYFDVIVKELFTKEPTFAPSDSPTTSGPTLRPTLPPSDAPTRTDEPTKVPTPAPTEAVRFCWVMGEDLRASCSGGPGCQEVVVETQDQCMERCREANNGCVQWVFNGYSNVIFSYD